MKKNILVTFSIVILAALLSAQEVPQRDDNRQVEIKDITPFSYAYLECKGSYQQIPVKIGEFMQQFFGQKLMPAGDFFAIYLNAPGQVKEEELLWRLGFPVPAEAAVTTPLQVGECKATKIASYLHVGPYEKVGEAYTKVFTFIESQGYKVAGPPMEKYLNNPQQVKPEELRTEINVPVEKK